MSAIKLGHFADPILDRQIDDICRSLAPTKKGATTARPALNVSDAGRLYFDTTLAADGQPIWWTGAKWVDSTGVEI